MNNLNKYFITFLIVVFIGLGAYYVVHFGYYPAAVVNGELVSAARLDREFRAAFLYYAKVGGEEEKIDVADTDFQKELRRAVLQSLIERELIGDELKEKIGGNFKVAVDKQLAGQKINGEAVEQAAKALYGLSMEDFRAMVLVPRAERELLEARLKGEKTALTDWLAGALKNANVFVVTPEFYWAEGKLNARE